MKAFRLSRSSRWFPTHRLWISPFEVERVHLATLRNTFFTKEMSGAIYTVGLRVGWLTDIHLKNYRLKAGRIVCD
jgi:hypothetical protein